MPASNKISVKSMKYDTKTYTYPVNKIIRSKDKVKKRIRKK